ncbi:type ISP restriction/modification enzyme [Gelidibacter japonicus]|uniref:type ISP restriction/modification enzyme n=1 Tax=Gelidibacter japonicus TaxID=1962232 RepID=UPI0013D57E08|nr:type ISP restriction/modification enzyme [Gelidibacter japonicus]
MDLKNENQAVRTSTTFSVPKDALRPYPKIGYPLSDTPQNGSPKQTNTNGPKNVLGLDTTTIKTIEKHLKLTFLSEKDSDNQVCMANSPEVRDEYRDVFETKDLLDYIFAVLHSPRHLKKYKDVSKIDILEIPYPNDSFGFWKLVDLGAKLRDLQQSELLSDENHTTQTDKILEKIAELEIE